MSETENGEREKERKSEREKERRRGGEKEKKRARERVYMVRLLHAISLQEALAPAVSSEFGSSWNSKRGGSLGAYLYLLCVDNVALLRSCLSVSGLV